MARSLEKLATIITLLSYQLALFADTSRVVVGCWCRQAGKDFTTACRAVTHALETHQDWYIVSVTQRQADATFAKCRKIAAAYRKVLQLKARITFSDREFVEYDRWLDHHFRCTARTLHLPGGGSVTALPGRDPDTLAGLTGNVIFTEFGLFPNGGYEHWRVVFPLTTRGYQVIVISTPRGRNTKFYELVSDPKTYSVHFVDIHAAVAGGLLLHDNNGRPTTIEEFRRIYNDEIGWRREYLLEFSGDLEALIRWAQLEAAGQNSPPLLTRVCAIVGESPLPAGFFDSLAQLEGRPEIGWDVARTSHLSALWVNLATPAARSLTHLVTMQKTSFARQRAIVEAAMDAKANAVGCGDATGLGMDSNETLHTRYGDRWGPVTFTASAKRDMASGLATAFDDGELRLPPMDGDHKFIATDLYALQCDRSGAGLKLIESENPLLPESHCDIAWAAALARKAGSMVSVQPHVWVA